MPKIWVELGNGLDYISSESLGDYTSAYFFNGEFIDEIENSPVPVWVSLSSKLEIFPVDDCVYQRPNIVLLGFETEADFMGFVLNSKFGSNLI